MIQDLRAAFRHWQQTPVVTLVALLSLALGIGATLALFALVDALLLRSLPVRDPQSLIRVVAEERRLNLGVVDWSFSEPVWTHIRTHQRFATSVFAVAVDRANLARDGEVRYVSSLYLSGNACDELGLTPALGRTLQPADDSPTAPPVTMISYGLWQRLYRGEPRALGDTLWVDGSPFTIVGVAPRNFFGLDVGRSADVLLPVSARQIIQSPQSPAQATSPWLTLYGRLAPGHTLEGANAALQAWQPALREETLPAGPAAEIHLINPLVVVSGAQGQSFLRRQYEQPLLMLLGAVVVVWLIACANLSALVFARFTDRQHELGVRLALGASRQRLVRALLVESVALAIAGAAAGIWMAHALVSAVIPYMTSPAFRGLPPDLPVAIDARLLLVATLLALTSGILSGALPAWRASRVAPQVSLSTAARGGLHGRRASRGLRAMVAVQVALSLVLVTSAALLVRSFVALVTGPAGVEPDRVLVLVLTGELMTPGAGARHERLETIQRTLAAVPGVDAVSAGIITPLSGGMAAAPLEVPGSTYEPPLNMPAGAASPFNFVLPGFFYAVGTPIVEGRAFDERDTAASTPVAIVNQAFADRHFRAGNPLGRVLRVGTTAMEIVGVVADSRTISLKEERSVAMAFGLLTQRTTSAPLGSLRFVVRSDRPDAARAPLAAALRTVDPRLSLEFRTMRDEADASVNRERLLAWLGGLFATLGLVMAAIGIYGTFAYAVVRRRSEIGVRMALGANRADILRMVLRDAALVLALGTVAGVAAAVSAGRYVQSLLFQLSARDPWTLTIAILLVILVAAVASFVPARRASRVEPVVALRAE